MDNLSSLKQNFINIEEPQPTSVKVVNYVEMSPSIDEISIKNSEFHPSNLIYAVQEIIPILQETEVKKIEISPCIEKEDAAIKDKLMVGYTEHNLEIEKLRQENCKIKDPEIPQNPFELKSEEPKPNMPETHLNFKEIEESNIPKNTDELKPNESETFEHNQVKPEKNEDIGIPKSPLGPELNPTMPDTHLNLKEIDEPNIPNELKPNEFETFESNQVIPEKNEDIGIPKSPLEFEIKPAMPDTHLNLKKIEEPNIPNELKPNESETFVLDQATPKKNESNNTETFDKDINITLQPKENTLEMDIDSKNYNIALQPEENTLEMDIDPKNINIALQPEENTQGMEIDLKDKKNLTSLQLNSALGCVFGAFIGDALGSAVEFQRTVSNSDLDRALLMNGGIFGNGPGQVTDDSELAMCILNGICESLPSFNSNSIAKYYKKWIESHPFDIGSTTRNAFYNLSYSNENLAEVAQRSSRKYNQDSLSNGSFMRSSPLAVYCRHLNDEETRKIVYEDSSMTHSNPIIHQTETMYILCLSHLIQYPKMREAALERALKYAENCDGIAKSWLDDVFNKKPMPGSPNMGYVKIAFDHSFRELMRESIDFESSMKRILLLGGDTDTNAAIVGAMIGAYVGYDNLPKHWKDKVEGFGDGVWGIKRPEFLNQRAVKSMVEKIFREAPRF